MNPPAWAGCRAQAEQTLVLPKRALGRAEHTGAGSGSYHTWGVLPAPGELQGGEGWVVEEEGGLEASTTPT